MMKYKRPDDSLKVEPIVYPREELLPPIHDRSARIYQSINWGKNLKGVEDGWIKDIFLQYNEVKFNFSMYRNCSHCISSFGKTRDKTAFFQDYLPKIKEGIKNGMMVEGISSPQSLNQYVCTETNAKIHLLYAAFASGRRDINILDEPAFLDKYSKYLLDNYTPSVPINSGADKLHDIIHTTEDYLTKFMVQFEEDMMNYEDYNAISKYNRDQALIFMMVCNDEFFKKSLRQYETYCRVLAICDIRYADLIISRFNTERDKLKKYDKYKNLSSDKDFIDAMTIRYNGALANGKDTYNPRYYSELSHGRKLPVPKNFKYLKNIVDTKLLRRFIKLLDSDNEQYLSNVLKTNQDSWNLINGLDRVLCLDNVRYINGRITEYNDDRSDLFYNVEYIQSLNPNDKPNRKSKNSTVTHNNVINFTWAQYNL